MSATLYPVSNSRRPTAYGRILGLRLSQPDRRTLPGLRTNASLFNTEDRRLPTASVYQPRLRLERQRVPSVARAESRPGSRLRPGEQLEISAATLENRACSPGRPLCPVQEGANGGTARQGEQLVISAATLENRASSPSRPSRPAQTLWKKALEEELGAVFGSRVPVRKAAERPSQGLSRELAGAVSGLNQALSSVKSGEPRRKSRTSY